MLQFMEHLVKAVSSEQFETNIFSLKHPPGIALEKIAITDNYVLIFTLLFSPLATIWAHTGPYGPVYHFILLLSVVYTLFYMNLGGSIHDLI